MKQYLDILKKIKDEGHSHPDRTGTGRRSIFGTSMRFDLSKGELPLVTTKKIFTKGFIKELLWFIGGETDVSYLKEDGVNIWNSWAVEESHIDSFFERLIKPLLSKQLDENNALKLMTAMDRDQLDDYDTSSLGESTISSSERNKIYEDHLKSFKTSTEMYLNKIGPMYGAIWRNAPGTMYTGLNPAPDYEDISSDKLGYYKDEYLNVFDKDSLLGADPQFREFALNKYVQTIDQLQNLILNLKKDPYSARHVVTALIPEYRSISGFSPQDNVLMKRGALDPCHMMFQCFVSPPKEEGGKLRLSLMLLMRSIDVAIGLPFNLAQYGLLTHMLAHVTDMEPYEFIFNGGDSHIYLNQLDLVDEQLSREPQPLPKLWLNPDVKDLFQFTLDDIKILDYNPLPRIDYPISI